MSMDTTACDAFKIIVDGVKSLFQTTEYSGTDSVLLQDSNDSETSSTDSEKGVVSEMKMWSVAQVICQRLQRMLGYFLSRCVKSSAYHG